jgi:hypothetical protein
MQIKICRIEDGPARVEVINPDGGAVVSAKDVNVGEEVVITTSDSPENPPFIGEVQTTEATEPAPEEATDDSPPASDDEGNAEERQD